MTPATAPANLDIHSRGFTKEEVLSTRYGNYTADPLETPGIVVSLVPQGASVLDVGCGNGQLSQLLKDDRNCTTLGIEPDSARASVCAGRGLNVINGLFTADLVGSLDTYDVVLFGDVLEHLSDPVELLLLAQKVLKPNGFVLVSVPNVAHWKIRLELLKGNFSYTSSGPMDATHLRWFTSETLTGLFEAAGFRVVERRASVGTFMPLYQGGRIWRRIPKKFAILRCLTDRFPKLFGCQLVFKAVPVATEGER